MLLLAIHLGFDAWAKKKKTFNILFDDLTLNLNGKDLDPTSPQ